MDQLITRKELRGMLSNGGSFSISNVTPSGTGGIEAITMPTLSTVSNEMRNESSNDVSKESRI
jgi:hypothetical protein